MSVFPFLTSWRARIRKEDMKIIGFFALAIVCYALGVDAVGFTGPDEPRYAEIVHEMRGNPLVPILWGKPWFEKPVLFYWVGMGFTALLGKGELSCRAGSIVAGLGVAFLLYLVMPGSRRLTAVAFLLAGPMWVGYSHGASPDMLFSASLASAILFAYQWIEGDARKVFAAYFCLALSLLAKGPVGPVLFGLIVGSYALMRSRLRLLWSWQHGLAIGTFAAVGLPWYVYLWATHGRAFIVEFFLNHNLRRYTTDIFQHPQPPYFFPLVLVLGMLPFSALLVFWRHFKREPFMLLSLLAVAWPLLFFSVSRSKLPGYVLPSIPFLSAILAGIYPERLAARIALAVAQAGAASYIWWRLHEIGLGPGRLLLVAVPFLLAVVLLGHPRVPLHVPCCVILVAYLLVKVAGGPFLDASFSSRPLARAVLARCHPEELVLFQEDRSTIFGISYYAGQRVRDVSDAASLRSERAEHVLTTPEGLGSLRSEKLLVFNALWSDGRHILLTSGD